MKPGVEDTWTECLTVHEKAGSLVSIIWTHQPLQQCAFRQEAMGRAVEHCIPVGGGNRFWHGYVLYEDITYKSRVPRTSQMTSRLLRHTAAVMRAHNVLCNSYNIRPLLCARITCYVTVITLEINHCSFRHVRFALLYIFQKNLLRHHNGNWYVHCVTQDLKMPLKQVRVTCICMR
jgi:hypothetical protein